MGLDAATFDLWETLIADSPEPNDRRTAYRLKETSRLLSSAGLSVAAAELEKAHIRVWEECSRSWERAVDLPFERQVSLFLDLARPGLAAAVPRDVLEGICDIYASATLLYPPALIPGAIEALSQLRSRGLKLGLICNTGRTPGSALRRLLEGMGVMGLLDAAFFSDETIYRKPDVRMFRAALEALGAEPGRSVHVGDSLENDVQGALGAGMRAVWICRNGRREDAPGIMVSSVAEVPRVLSGP